MVALTFSTPDYWATVGRHSWSILRVARLLTHTGCSQLSYYKQVILPTY